MPKGARSRSPHLVHASLFQIHWSWMPVHWSVEFDTVGILIWRGDQSPRLFSLWSQTHPNVTSGNTYACTSHVVQPPLVLHLWIRQRLLRSRLFSVAIRRLLIRSSFFPLEGSGAASSSSSFGG
eukprot:566822-Amphidinium_carterae.1